MNLPKSLLTAASLLLLSPAPAWAVITIVSHNLGGGGLLLRNSRSENLTEASSRIRIGFFDNPTGNAAIISGNDFNAISNIFTPLGEGAAGGGTVGSGALTISPNDPGRFNVRIEGITQQFLPQGTPLYIWVLNSPNPPGPPTTGDRLEWSIFTNNDSNNGGFPWTAPLDDPGGVGLALATTDIRVDDADDIQKGILSSTGILTVPEPSSLALLGLAFTCLRRRRNF